MSQYVDGKFKSYLGTSSISAHLRVYLASATTVTTAGADNAGMGTIETPSTATNGPCTVRLWNSEGTRKVVANAAISAGALVFAAASGKVGASGSVPLAIALEAATADGDIIEVQPLRPGTTVSFRQRITTANVNAGATLLAAVPGLKWRMQDVMGIAVGGSAATVTTVDILGTQSSSSVKLAAFAQASMTQSTVLRPGVSGTTVLANGASFVANDANTAITIGKTGSDLATATHVDVIGTFVLDV